jgi:hypothetical protein
VAQRVGDEGVYRLDSAGRLIFDRQHLHVAGDSDPEQIILLAQPQLVHRATSSVDENKHLADARVDEPQGCFSAVRVEYDDGVALVRCVAVEGSASSRHLGDQ